MPRGRHGQRLIDPGSLIVALDGLLQLTPDQPVDSELWL